MKDAPQAIRREMVNSALEVLERHLDAAIPKKSRIDLSIRSLLIRRQGRVAGRGHVRKSADRFPENLGAIA